MKNFDNYCPIIAPGHEYQGTVIKFVKIRIGPENQLCNTKLS